MNRSDVLETAANDALVELSASDEIRLFRTEAAFDGEHVSLGNDEPASITDGLGGLRS